MSKRDGILQPLFLATILTLGLGTAWAAVATWAAQIAAQIGRGDRHYEYLRFRIDGTPLIESRAFKEGYVDVTYRTLQGDPLPAEKVQSQRGIGGRLLRGPKPPGMGFQGMPWADRILSTTDQRKPPTFWYFVHTGEPDGTGCFVGYGSDTKLPAGYLGREGFRREELPAEEHFVVDGRRAGHRGDYSAILLFSDSAPGYQPSFYPQYEPPGAFSSRVAFLISGDQLYEIDFQKRSVRVVRELAGLVAVNLVQRALPRVPGQDDEQTEETFTAEQYMACNVGRLGVRTEDRILILDTQGNELASYALPDAIRSADLTFFELANGNALAFLKRPAGPESREYDLFWFDPSGRVVNREDIVLSQGSQRLSDPATSAYLATIGYPAPAAITTIACVFTPLEHLRSGQEDTYAGALARSLRAIWPGLAIVYLVAAGLAWGCLRRQRGRGLGRACRRPVPRDRPVCSDCGREFPEPAAKETEVFA
ncbi:MAG: hypothetical protein ACYTG0_45850 [Planctomycetota bacterium]|jgi:hypothetical protein